MCCGTLRCWLGCGNMWSCCSGGGGHGGGGALELPRSAPPPQRIAPPPLPVPSPCLPPPFATALVPSAPPSPSFCASLSWPSSSCSLSPPRTLQSPTKRSCLPHHKPSQPLFFLRKSWSLRFVFLRMRVVCLGCAVFYTCHSSSNSKGGHPCCSLNVKINLSILHVCLHPLLGPDTHDPGMNGRGPGTPPPGAKNNT